MNYIYAALLLHSAGKPINEEGLRAVVAATGTEPDVSRIKAMVSALEGVNIDEAISKAAMPVAASAAPAAPAEKKVEASAEEEKKKAEEAVEGLSALFG
ncbi:MAG: 50S ribosomal protein P1 [Candidatus Aenigmatarchaeota archaeon]